MHQKSGHMTVNSGVTSELQVYDCLPTVGQAKKPQKAARSTIFLHRSISN